MSENKREDDTQSDLILTNGMMVSHYRIIEKIGAGGMGEVYLAEDTKLDRKVALKFLSGQLSSSADARTRFTREAQAVAWAKLSQVYNELTFDDFSLKDIPNARDALDRALDLDPNLPEGHLALGTYYTMRTMEYEKAHQEYELAASGLVNSSELYR